MAWAPVIGAGGEPLWINRDGDWGPAWVDAADCTDCCVALCAEVGDLCECLDGHTPSFDLNISGFEDQSDPEIIQPCDDPPGCDPINQITHVEVLWSNLNGNYGLDYLDCDIVESDIASFALILEGDIDCVGDPEGSATRIRENGILVAREWNEDCPELIGSPTIYEAERYVVEISAGVFCVSEEGVSFTAAWSGANVYRIFSGGSWGAWTCAGSPGNPAQFILAHHPKLCGTEETTTIGFCEGGTITYSWSSQVRITQDANDCIDNLNSCTGGAVTLTGVLGL